MLGRWVAMLLCAAQLSGISAAQWASVKANFAMRSGILLRLHVVAQGDSDEEQRVKLCVRDAVQRVYADSESSEGRMIDTAARLLPELTEAAQSAARAEGFMGPVTVSLEQAVFDDRELDGMIFPAGAYPALMIRLGAARGHNWWGLIDPELALDAARTGENGLLLWEWNGVQWRLCLPVFMASLLCPEVSK